MPLEAPMRKALSICVAAGAIAATSLAYAGENLASAPDSAPAAASCGPGSAKPARDDLMLGTEALRNRQWHKAVEVTQSALAGCLTDEQRTVALNNLCVGLANLDDARAALPVCTKSVVVSDGEWSTLVNRASLYRQLGKERLADADLAKAMSLHTDPTIAHLADDNFRDEVPYVVKTAP
jgi:Flp pilus assembly protein TadD